MAGASARAGALPGLDAAAAGQVRDAVRRILADPSALAGPVEHAIAAPGKRLRSLVTLAAASLDPRRDAPRAAFDAAAALEAIHDATLVHDDILDESATRRGQPAVPAFFGVRAGFFAGAYMAAKGLAAIASLCERAGFPPGYDLLRELAAAQALEFLPPSGDGPRRERRLRAVADGKTGVLFRLCVRVGSGLAAAAGAACPDPRSLDRFAIVLGRGFQMRDDILDILGDASLKRPGGGDLARGVMSWPLHFWMQGSPDPVRDLARLAEAARDAESASRVAREVLASGALAQACRALQRELGEAQALVEPLPSSRGRRALLHLVHGLALQ